LNKCKSATMNSGWRVPYPEGRERQRELGTGYSEAGTAWHEAER
jgi:hypothetical protein